MNSKLDTDLLAAITELRQRYPHWRLGQLIVNVAGWVDQEIWDVDDEQLLKAARLHLEQSPSRNREPDAEPDLSPHSAVPRA
ncbi:MAG TPA: hypothetical protein VND64_24095 [Pirellulales bacterium]|nr:hypothetical protein [Pirellulales bacterium]